jgi:LuxR family maltose regulon positive regulatory protein
MFLFQDTLRINTELIVEKITVPSESPRISRPRLLVLLEKSLASCTSTVISGRAGTGKTSLALDFSRNCGLDVAWYKVDATEAELKIFFQYLIACIRAQRPNFGTKTLLSGIEKVRLEQIPTLAEAFVFELVEGESIPLLIVIEDLHLVCDSEWVVPFFQRLLPLLPSEVHMLITSRTMPPAPLWRMRSKQTLSVIDEAVLAFTRQEAIELFQNYGLSAEQANIALDHAHGRAAALTGFAETLSSSEIRIPKDSYAPTVIS